MRADRLLSVVLLLQHRGLMTAASLARELEVSTRTILRDVESLSTVGIPIYAERGRGGGFALLPGFSTDLTGLTHDEALALVVAGSRATPDAGMAPALAAAMRKVVGALPPPQRKSAVRDAERILVRPEGWLPHARRDPDVRDAGTEERLGVVRRAVFAGRRLRIRFAAAGEQPRWRTIDPVGLVNAGGRWYLLATRDGADRTYRLSRLLAVEELMEAAARPEGVDLDMAWRERRARFPAQPGLPTQIRIRAVRVPDVMGSAVAVTAEVPGEDGWTRADVTFADVHHAMGVLWALSPDVEALGPATLRTALAERAAATAGRYDLGRGTR